MTALLKVSLSTTSHVPTDDVKVKNLCSINTEVKYEGKYTNIGYHRTYENHQQRYFSSMMWSAFSPHQNTFTRNTYIITEVIKQS